MNEIDALGHCLMMQGLHILEEKSGSAVVLPINIKKSWQILSIFSKTTNFLQ
jgi:hypothetical protein